MEAVMLNNSVAVKLNTSVAPSHRVGATMSASAGGLPVRFSASQPNSADPASRMLASMAVPAPGAHEACHIVPEPVCGTVWTVI
jgi:hypothetical protein